MFITFFTVGFYFVWLSDVTVNIVDSTIDRRQVGHCLLYFSACWIHSAWKIWLHDVSKTADLSVKSNWQTTHWFIRSSLHAGLLWMVAFAAILLTILPFLSKCEFFVRSYNACGIPCQSKVPCTPFPPLVRLYSFLSFEVLQRKRFHTRDISQSSL